MWCGLLKRYWSRSPRPKSGFGRLTVDPSCKVAAEYIGGLHADVVVDGKDCISARFPLLKPEVSLRQKDVETVPCHIAPDEELPYTRGNFTTYVGLQ